MAPKVEICYMDNKETKKTPSAPPLPEIKEGCWENFLERFRWFQQHGEPAESQRDNTRPYRGEQ